jgi:hypothetical protein
MWTKPTRTRSSVLGQLARKVLQTLTIAAIQSKVVQMGMFALLTSCGAQLLIFVQPRLVMLPMSPLAVVPVAQGTTPAPSVRSLLTSLQMLSVLLVSVAHRTLIAAAKTRHAVAPTNAMRAWC